MSIGNVASNAWTPPFPPQSGVGGAWGAFPLPPDANGIAQGSSGPAGVGSSWSGTGTSATGPTNPFQRLASDIQALLLQAQGGTAAQAASTTGAATTSTGTSATGVSPTGGTTAATPEQQLATDLQSLLAQLQSNQAGSGQSRQMATTGQTDATGQTQPHHHHHHHHEGGGQEGATTVTVAGGATASSTTAASASATSGTSASANDQTVSRAFAAEIVQALQAYGSTPPTTNGSGLTA